MQFILVPALAMLFATAAGAASRDRAWPQPVVLGGWLVWIAVVMIVAADGRDPAVSESDFTQGLLLAFGAIGLVPFAVFYLLGRITWRQPFLLVVAWAVLQVPLFYYLFIAYIVVAGYVSCPPDAYECPL